MGSRAAIDISMLVSVLQAACNPIGISSPENFTFASCSQRFGSAISGQDDKVQALAVCTSPSLFSTPSRILQAIGHRSAWQHPVLVWVLMQVTTGHLVTDPN